MYINPYRSTHMHMNKVKKRKQNNILSRKIINNKRGCLLIRLAHLFQLPAQHLNPSAKSIWIQNFL